MSLLSIVYPTLPRTTAWPLGGDLAVKAEAGAEREGMVEATPQNTQEWGGQRCPPCSGPTPGFTAARASSEPLLSSSTQLRLCECLVQVPSHNLPPKSFPKQVPWNPEALPAVIRCFWRKGFCGQGRLGKLIASLFWCWLPFYCRLTAHYGCLCSSHHICIRPGSRRERKNKGRGAAPPGESTLFEDLSLKIHQAPVLASHWPESVG